MAAAAETLPANLSFGQRFTGLPASQRMRLMGGVALVVLVIIAAIVMGRQADWRVLYANLPEKDGGAVVAQLAQMNVPYKYTDGGGAIMVPSDRVYDTRLRLASLGLPKGSVAGFESTESNRFGMTQFQERLSFQRGLEGELTRSIQAISSVQGARVHLALPNQNGFFREQQKPSASVLVTLYPGHTLDRNQLAGIIHLVSSSVPEMPRTAVSVLDDTGKLLSAPGEGLDAGGAVDAQQLAYAQQIEQSYSRRILDILEPVVGRNNVRAQVSAEIDFSQSEQTSETHRPNQTPDASAVRSQQTLESSGGTAPVAPAGVPGAVTNQPPGNASAPVNGAAQAVGPAGGASGAAGGAQGAVKRESIINYEVDKTVRVVRGGSGSIKRITAAVVLNNQTTTEANGNVVSTPISPEQLERMTALVRQTIGFNQERGDSVNVVNAAFALDKAPTSDLPLWRQPEVQEMARGLAWPVVAGLLALVVLLAVVRPAVKAMTAPPLPPASEEGDAAEGEGGVDALVADQPDRPPLLGADGAPILEMSPEAKAHARLETARRLTRENPAAVANIVKAWMGTAEAPG
jgi:flagellar M-ring protein FliF